MKLRYISIKSFGDCIISFPILNQALNLKVRLRKPTLVGVQNRVLKNSIASFKIGNGIINFYNFFMSKTIINKAIYEKARNGLMQLKSKGTAANKLKAIMAAYNHGSKKVSEILDINITSIYKWTIKLDREGYESLINQAKHHEGIKVKKFHKEEIKKWLEKDSHISITKVKENLEKQFHLEVSRSTVHRAMKEVGFSYITPRKNHYKQDKKQAEDFKKKSTR